MKATFEDFGFTLGEEVPVKTVLIISERSERNGKYRTEAQLFVVGKYVALVCFDSTADEPAYLSYLSYLIVDSEFERWTAYVRSIVPIYTIAYRLT